MLESSLAALDMVQGMGRDDLNKDRVVVAALVRNLQIIGEAARCVSEEVQASNPGIPWSHIIAMRHRLVHEYFAVDIDVVWRTLSEDLQPLVQALEMALSKQDD